MICCLSEIQTYLGVLYFDLLKSNNATIVRKRNVLDCRDLAQWNLSIVLTTFIMDPILDSLSLSPNTKGESQAASQLWENKINKLIESSFSVLLFSCAMFSLTASALLICQQTPLGGRQSEQLLTGETPDRSRFGVCFFHGQVPSYFLVAKFFPVNRIVLNANCVSQCFSRDIVIGLNMKTMSK